MSPNLIGIIAIVASQICFIVNDSLVKLIASRIPADAGTVLPVGETIVLRGLATVFIIAVLVVALGHTRDLSRVRSARMGFRAVAEIGASMAYLFAVIGMPIADLVGILQVVPLGLTAGAALFLGEPIGWRRWSATIIGFVGVLFIIKPGATPLSTPVLFAILSVTLIIVRDLLTRGLPRGIPVLLISGTSAVALTLGGLCFAPFEQWVWPSQTQWVWLAIAAVHLVGANTFLILSLRVGEIAVVGPFRYSVILIAVLSGFWAWIGIAIVTAAGIYTLVREQSLATKIVDDRGTT
jgi:drug/metabolite transporter (DMT)-like permease